MKLPHTTAQRLRLYKTRAAASKWSNDWRKHRHASTWGTAWHSGIRADGIILTDDRDTLGDYLGDWTSFASYRDMRDTNGFYIDDYYNDTLRGGVVRLRCARFTLYIPCTYCTGWDGATYYMADAERVERGAEEIQHDDAQRQAAANAYHYAEREADVAREDNAKQRAADDIHDRRTEIHDINKATRALLAEIRGKEFTDNICAALRYRLQEYLADRRKCFEIIKERTENYWSAVSC